MLASGTVKLNPFTHAPPSYAMEAPHDVSIPQDKVNAEGPASTEEKGSLKASETPNDNGTNSRPSNDKDIFDRLISIQETEDAAAPPPNSTLPTNPIASIASPTSAKTASPSQSPHDAGQADIGEVQEFDRETPNRQQRNIAARPANVTNYISLARRSTNSKSTSIKDTFRVDPHLKIPGSVLAAVTGETEETGGGANRRRKNVKLEIENGAMDVVLHLVADNDTISSRRKRMRSFANLNVRSTGEASKRQTKLDIKVTTRKSTKFKAYPLKARLHAPAPRPPFHLICTADSPEDLEIPTASPLTLFLPRNFHGPLKLRITAGNIDRHLHISPSVLSNTVPLDEDAINRGYFIGPLQQDGDVEEEEEAVPGNLGDWKGDRVEIYVEDGNVRILYEDEELGWFENMKSNGWMWPRGWF